MSSLRVRAQNKLLATLGTNKPSKNVQFDFAFAGYEKTQAGVAELEAALRNYIICLRGHHLSAQALVRVIDNVGSNPENTASTKQFANEIKSAFVQLDGHLLNDSVKRFEQRVLNPAVGWLTRGHALKQQIATFHEEKLLYDHYTRKVMALREARDKRAGSGKPEKPKDVEKLVRNEQKYAAITNSYSKISDQTIANLREFVNNREDTLTPILHRMLEFRVKYAQQVHDESLKLQSLIKSDSKYDAIMGQLESFVGRLVSGSATSATTTSSASTEQANPAPVEPDVPVQSFSFASFVGEAPPTVPPESHDATTTESSSRASSFTADDGAARPSPSLASPSSPDALFFNDFAHSATISPMAAAPMALDFQPPPPPPPPSAPAGSTDADAWSTFPSKPSAPPMSAATFTTMPATDSSSNLALSSAALTSTWGAFDDLTPPPQVASSGNPFQFQTDFADLHQNALGSSDVSRGVSGSVSF